MAEIRIERKTRRTWPWLVLVLVLMLAAVGIWLVAGPPGILDEVGAEPAPEAGVEQAAPGTPGGDRNVP
jgi:hypothetical protein